MDPQPPYWLLISVLFSSQPLSPALALYLYHAALDLHRRDETATQVAGDLASGILRNLKKHVMLGTIGGPTFEASLETERGSATVRFLLTREGLQGTVPAPSNQYLN